MSTSALPALVLGCLFCIGYASLLHFWTGRHVRDLLITLFMAIMGFGFGQAIGFFTEVPLLRIGQLHLLEASLGAWVLMCVARMIAP